MSESRLGQPFWIFNKQLIFMCFIRATAAEELSSAFSLITQSWLVKKMVKFEESHERNLIISCHVMLPRNKPPLFDLLVDFQRNSLLHLLNRRIRRQSRAPPHSQNRDIMFSSLLILSQAICHVRSTKVLEHILSLIDTISKKYWRERNASD